MAERTIRCPKCGTSNPEHLKQCMKCKTVLVQAPKTPAVAPKAEAPRARQSSGGSGGMSSLLAGLGFGGALLVAGWVVLTMADIQDMEMLSAIQVTQLYTQASFWVLVIIAMLLAGILGALSQRR